jgi:hypothetical protein
MLQGPAQPSEDELKKFFEHHLPSAHAAYYHVPSIATYESRLRAQLNALSLEYILKTLTGLASLQIDDDLLHHIFVILPSEDRSRHLVQFASQYWLDFVVSTVKREKIAAEAQKLFDVFVGNPFTGGAAGQLLDSVVGDIFARGGVWPIHEMEKSGTKGKRAHYWKIEASKNYDNKYLIIGHPSHPPVLISPDPPKETTFQHIKIHILPPSTSTDSPVTLCTGYYSHHTLNGSPPSMDQPIKTHVLAKISATYRSVYHVYNHATLYGCSGGKRFRSRLYCT